MHIDTYIWFPSVGNIKITNTKVSSYTNTICSGFQPFKKNSGFPGYEKQEFRF